MKVLGEAMNFSETFIVVMAVIAVVLVILILYAITLISRLSKMILDAQSGKAVEQSQVKAAAVDSIKPQNNVKILESSEDEEERLVAALAASAMAASDRPESHFHITKITRVK